MKNGEEIFEKIKPYICFDYEFYENIKYIKLKFNNNKDYLYLFILDNIIVLKDRHNKFLFYYEYREYDFYQNISQLINELKFFMRDSKENLSLFSGAFNPFTLAHENVCNEILKDDTIDFLFISASNHDFLLNKFKKKQTRLYTEEERIQMLLKITYDNPRIILYGIENGRTYHILSNIKEKYNPKKLFFVLGADKVNQIKKWYCADKLLSEFGFIILTRDDINKDELQNDCKDVFKFFKVIETKKIYKNVSSTKVRENLNNMKELETLVNKRIIDIL